MSPNTCLAFKLGSVAVQEVATSVTWLLQATLLVVRCAARFNPWTHLMRALCALWHAGISPLMVAALGTAPGLLATCDGDFTNCLKKHVRESSQRNAFWLIHPVIRRMINDQIHPGMIPQPRPFHCAFHPPPPAAGIG